MKIQGPSKTGSSSKSGKSGSVSKGDSTFSAMVAGAAQGTSNVASTHSIAKVDALLAVQGAESVTERAAKRRMHERGNKIIDQLDDLRMGVLSGTLTIGQVIDIADVVASHREKITDPELSSILDEIDLRAQIEIAKMRKAMEAGA